MLHYPTACIKWTDDMDKMLTDIISVPPEICVGLE